MIQYKKFLKSSVIMTWLALGVRLGGFFLLLPIILNRFSLAEVSVWLLFSSIFSLLLLIDFGFSQTFSREISFGFSGATIDNLFLAGKNSYIATPLVENTLEIHPNWETINLIYQAMGWLYQKLAIGVIFIMGILGTWSVIIPIEKTQTPQENYLAWLVIIFGSCAVIYGWKYSSFLIGANRISDLKKWDFIVSGGSLLLQYFSVIAGWGILGITLINQCALILQVGINRKLVKDTLITNNTSFKSIKLVQELVRNIWPMVWRSGVGIIANLGVLQGTVIVLVNCLTPSLAASLQLSIRVMQTINHISQVPFYTKIPEMNRLMTKRAIVPLVSIAKKRMKWSYLIYAFGITFSGLTIPYLLKYIHSDTHFVDNKFWFTLSLAFLFERFGAMHMQIYTTTRHIVWHIANTVTGILWVLFMIILYPIIEIYSVPIAMLIANITFFSWYTASFSFKIMGLSGSEFFKFNVDTVMISFLIVLGNLLWTLMFL